jgi:hypothetical protein
VTSTAALAGVRRTDLNTTRTKPRPKPRAGTAGSTTESDSPVIVDPLPEPNPRITPSPLLSTQPADHSDAEKRVPTTVCERWARIWPSLLAVVTLSVVGIVVALWPPICLAITLELVALVAYPAKQHPAINDVRPGARTGHVPDAQPAPGHAPTEPICGDQAPQTREAREDTSHESRHPVGQEPADPAAQTEHAPAARLASTNRHLSRPDRAVPAQAQPDATNRAGQLPVPASTYPGSGTKPGHEAGQNGHHDQTRTERVPDSDILTWLRHQADTTGRVPGRRQMIERWALGSTRAECLRAIVIKDAASKTPAPAG